MSDARSVYEVECLCGEKVRTFGRFATCSKCGREIELEGWQVSRTMTAAGSHRYSGNGPTLTGRPPAQDLSRQANGGLSKEKP